MFSQPLIDHLIVSVILPYTWIISSFLVVITQAFLGVKAAYGRYNESKTGIPGRLAWFIQELPSFVIPCYLLYQYWRSVSMIQILLVIFFVIHYFQRTFVYPMMIRGGKASPFSTTAMAFIFCILNSYSIVKDILVYHIYPENTWLSLHFLLGTSLFFAGFLLNLQADAILRNLRSNDQDQGYKIPRGGLFEYVSGANFLAESIEWTGFAICAWTLPALAFAMFTWANIGFGRAIQHHQYYLEKFKGEYPQKRKAIIPFIL